VGVGFLEAQNSWAPGLLSRIEWDYPHYRETLHYDERALAASDALALDMAKAATLPPSGSGEALETGRYTDGFFQAMDDDLRTPVAVAVLAELAQAIESAFGSFYDFKEKFQTAGANQSGPGWAWLVLDGGDLKVTSTPNSAHDWTNQRDPAFSTFPPLGDKTSPGTDVLFNTYSRGLESARDAWVYNYSRDKVEAMTKALLEFETIDADQIGGRLEARIDRTGRAPAPECATVALVFPMAAPGALPRATSAPPQTRTLRRLRIAPAHADDGDPFSHTAYLRV